MENLIFFVLGFITYKVLKFVYIKTTMYLAFRKKRSQWVCRGNFNNRLHYDKRLVK
jgi:hypothetical protein